MTRRPRAPLPNDGAAGATRALGGRALAGFAAGAAAVLTVHQGALAVLGAAGASPWPAYSTAPTPPLGVPAVWSAAFWGGLWGIGLAAVAAPSSTSPSAARELGRAAAFGAVLPNLVGAALLAAGRGPATAERALSPAAALVTAVVVNGLWGAATAVILRALRRCVGSAW